MSWSNAGELLRIVVVLAVIFVIAPCLSLAYPLRVGPAEWGRRMVAAFVRTSLFFVVLLLALSKFRLNLPGAILGAYICWLILNAAWVRRQNLFAGDTPWQVKAVLPLARLQGDWVRWVSDSVRAGAAILRRSPLLMLFALSGVALFAQRLSFALFNRHFFAIETYLRAISLQALTHGDAWPADGSVALLAPLVFLTGLNPASVMRWSGPIFATALAGAAALCALRLSKRVGAAYVAFALAGVLPLFLQGMRPAGEIGKPEMAALYVVLGLVAMVDSWRLGVYCLATALFIDSPVNVLSGLVAPLCAAGIAVSGIRLAERMPQRMQNRLWAVFAVGAIVILSVRFEHGTVEGPHQYEAAARACSQIARRFPSKDWVLVSPGHELAFTYGQGWHVELLDFVNSFDASQVADTSFAFPYSAKYVFIFIEKRPCSAAGTSAYGARMAGLTVADTLDRAVLSYGTPLGRASVEYQGAALIAAYGRTHKDLATFFEDDKLVIYCIERRRV